MSNSFQQHLRNEGIVHERTTPNTPQQNGKAERMNRTLVEAAKSMMHAAGLSYGFWQEAITTAVHVRNRAPKRAFKWRTSFEVLTGTKPDVSRLRVFGCLAYRHIHKDDRRKLEPNAQPLVFVGYEANSKGYRLWDKRSRKIVVSTDVVFDETVFPYRTQPSPSGQPAMSNPTPKIGRAHV